MSIICRIKRISSGNRSYPVKPGQADRCPDGRSGGITEIIRRIACNQQGYTLVEILVTLTITGLIATGTTAVTAGLCKQEDFYVESTQNIIMTLESVTSDMEQATSGQVASLTVETPDASNLQTNPLKGNTADRLNWPYHVYDSCDERTQIWPAQTFTALKSGKLTRIVLKTGYVTPGKTVVVIVELQNVNASGKPAGTAIATGSKKVSSNTETEFILKDGQNLPQVSSGQKYALVIKLSDRTGKWVGFQSYTDYVDSYPHRDCYTPGDAFIRDSRTGVWQPSCWGEGDLYFRTWVR